MAEVQPTAIGTLEATPLPHLLVYALDRQLEGTLVFEAPDGGRSALFLVDGSPAKARTAETVIHLGRLLLEMGLVDEKTHNRTLGQVAASKELHGQLLIRENAIDVETLRAALREQIARQVLWMFTLPEKTAYGFYEGVNYLERWGGPESTRVQPLGLLWRGIRAHAEPRRVVAALDRLGNGALHLHPDGQIGRFNLEPREQATVDVLRVKPQSVSELFRLDLVPEETCRRLIYALAITRHLDVGVPGSVPVGVDEAPSSSRIAIQDGTAQVRRHRRLTTGSRRATRPGFASAPDVEERERPPSEAEIEFDSQTDIEQPEDPKITAFKAQVVDLSLTIKSQNYFEILGIPNDAPKAAIQAAFFQLAKRWHPDRISAELGDLRGEATRIFARMSEAHQVLTDDRLRAEYNEVIKEGGASSGEQDEIQAVLRAATAFQKAEVFLKRNNLPGAEEQARIALDNDPSQADYIALFTWIQAQKSGLDGHTVEQLIERLDVAIGNEPENPRARWYRGQLLKRVGNYDLAVKDFRYIVDRDSKHLDATREIRLYEMRKSAMRSAQPQKLSSSNPPKPGSNPPPRPSVRPRTVSGTGKSVPPPPEKKSGLNRDIGDLLGKWFKR